MRFILIGIVYRKDNKILINRFMDKFGMQNCETFIRGTIRFGGFSNVISAFHDIGLTSDDLVPSTVKSLRDLAEARF